MHVQVVTTHEVCTLHVHVQVCRTHDVCTLHMDVQVCTTHKCILHMHVHVCTTHDSRTLQLHVQVCTTHDVCTLHMDVQVCTTHDVYTLQLHVQVCTTHNACKLRIIYNALYVHWICINLPNLCNYNRHTECYVQVNMTYKPHTYSLYVHTYVFTMFYQDAAVFVLGYTDLRKFHSQMKMAALLQYSHNLSHTLFVKVH